VGAAGDIAAIESFFTLLPNDVRRWKVWVTREELRIAVVTWIERSYQRRLRQDALGRLMPVKFETIITTSTTQAAWAGLSPDRAPQRALLRRSLLQQVGDGVTGLIFERQGHSN